MKKAEGLNTERREDEMKIEFVSFCRVVLRLLSLGKIQEAIEELKTIIEKGE